jgi:hypothetical protein
MHVLFRVAVLQLEQALPITFEDETSQNISSSINFCIFHGCIILLYVLNVPLVLGTSPSRPGTLLVACLIAIANAFKMSVLSTISNAEIINSQMKWDLHHLP